MKVFRVTLNVSRNASGSYRVKSDNGLWGCCLCSDTYEDVIGKEVTGDVTFIMRKIKGNAKNYIHPFRIRSDALEVRESYGWQYAKGLGLLSGAFDVNELEDWAGTSKFSIEMEW